MRLDSDGEGAMSQDALKQVLLNLGLADKEIIILLDGARRNSSGAVPIEAFLEQVFEQKARLDAKAQPPGSNEDVRSVEARAIASRADFFEVSALGTGCRIKLTEERAITLKQLRAVLAQIDRRCAVEEWSGFTGDTLKPEEVNLYDVNKYVILPATVEKQCSFVELFASSPQKPRFFVSHWWGEPVRAFIFCLAAHSTDHMLDEFVAYWVCAYANNQWNLAAAVVEDPALTSFHKAMALADGTVSVLDEGGVVFTRIWCAYEVHVSLMHSTPGYSWSVYTALEHDGRMHSMYRKREPEYHAVGLVEGDAPDDAVMKGPPGFIKRFRESKFPLSLAEAALRLSIETSQASVESDRVHILNRMISSASNADLKATPQMDHPRLKELNFVLRSRFAAGSLRAAIEKGGETMDIFFKALKAGRMRRLSLGFSDCRAFNSEVAEQLVAHLPQGLEQLEISHANHFQAGSALLTALGKWLQDPEAAGLKVLDLKPLTGVPEEYREELIEANKNRATPLDLADTF